MTECDLTISEVFQAYYDCRKTKRNTWNALQFEQNLERNLMDLYYDLINKTYEPGRSIMFVVTRPKAREVWAADFRDRIVHHILYNKYSDKFYRKFIHDSYACIPNKGTLKAVNRVQHFIRSVTENHTRPASFLKADISNFFVSINKSILDTLLAKEIVHEWWQWLFRIILHKDASENVYIKSSPKLLKKVPAHKSLLNAPKGYGLPIGNLSSQFFANIYLNELDQYAKHILKLKYYARYVDDIVVLGNKETDFNTVYYKMNYFLQQKLGVYLHPSKKEINTIDHGISFVGYIIKPFCIYIRRSTINNMYRATINMTQFDELRPTINSYFGMLRHTNAYKERAKAAIYFGKQHNCQFDKHLTKLTKLGEI